MGQLTTKQLEVIRSLARLHGITSVRLFGSRAKGTAGSQSDVDLLVRFAQPASLIDLIGFKQALEEALALQVDVVEEDALPLNMHERILGEARAL